MPSMNTTADGHHIADDRFPPGTKVTISDFEPGDWHVAWDWPEDVPTGFERHPRIAGRGADGVPGYAFIDPDRMTAHPPTEEPGPA